MSPIDTGFPHTNNIALQAAPLLRTYETETGAKATNELTRQCREYVEQRLTSNRDVSYRDWINQLNHNIVFKRTKIKALIVNVSKAVVDTKVTQKKTVTYEWINRTDLPIKITYRTQDTLIVQPSYDDEQTLTRVYSVSVNISELTQYLNEEDSKNGTQTEYYGYLLNKYHQLLSSNSTLITIHRYLTFYIGSLQLEGYYIDELDVVVSRVDQLVEHPTPGFGVDKTTIDPTGITMDITVYDKGCRYSQLFMKSLNLVLPVPIIRTDGREDRFIIVAYDASTKKRSVKEYPITHDLTELGLATNQLDLDHDHYIRSLKKEQERLVHKLNIEKTEAERQANEARTRLAQEQQENLIAKERLNTAETKNKEKQSKQDQKKSRYNERNERLKIGASILAFITSGLALLLGILKATA